MRSRAASLAASALFLFVASGTVAGYLPWLITGWRFAGDPSQPVRIVGLPLILAGGAVLLECFVRFAWTGFGTPPPIAPIRRLIVTGLYRHLRNPMYVAVFALIAGQASKAPRSAMRRNSAAVKPAGTGNSNRTDGSGLFMVSQTGRRREKVHPQSTLTAASAKYR